MLRHSFIPTIFGQPPPNDLVRAVLALPARLGGIDIYNPTKTANQEFNYCCQICEPILTLLSNGIVTPPSDLYPGMSAIKTTIKRSRRNNSVDAMNSLETSLPKYLQRALELAQEKGSSLWLTSMPIKEFGFDLHKTAFLDALSLRYCWQPSRLPTLCDCGRNCSIEHALSCPKGGFPSATTRSEI